MNHKRGKPKNARSGCLMCKPHKMNHAKDPDTMDVAIADQPEDGRWGNKSRPKPGRWPRPFRISCRHCGRLQETRMCANRREYAHFQFERFKCICVECKAKIARANADEQARRNINVL